MKKILRGLAATVLGVVGLVVLGLAVLWFGGHSWPAVQEQKVSCSADAPQLSPGATVRVLNWNVQYLAGKNYVFFYDLPDGSGPHDRPSTADIAATAKEVARVIDAESPDLVLLQEVDDGASRTDRADQTDQLVAELKTRYPCRSEAFYWKALFVPHPRVMGSTGMKVVTLSRFKIDGATRHALPPIPADAFTQRLGLHRAVLESRLPIEGGGHLSVMNTHLDAFAQGTNIMDRQVKIVANILKKRRAAGVPWILGGDFNLLPPNIALSTLPKVVQGYYNPRTEIAPLFDSFESAITLAQLNGPERARFFTLNPNNPALKVKPDRTIDYIFYSRLLTKRAARVRMADTMQISDHLPLIADFVLPAGGR